MEQISADNQVWPVKKILLLSSRNEEDFKLQRLHGSNKLKVLRDNIYRDQLIDGLGMMEVHFQSLSRLANQVSLFHIERPSMPLRTEELTNLVIKKVIDT